MDSYNWYNLDDLEIQFKNATKPVHLKRYKEMIPLLILYIQTFIKIKAALWASVEWRRPKKCGATRCLKSVSKNKLVFLWGTWIIKCYTYNSWYYNKSSIFYHKSQSKIVLQIMKQSMTTLFIFMTSFIFTVL